MQENGALRGIGQLFHLKVGTTAQILKEPVLVLRQPKNPTASTLCVPVHLKVSNMLGTAVFQHWPYSSTQEAGAERLLGA